MSRKQFWYLMMSSVILGWLFVFAGAFFSYSGTIKTIWLFLIVIFSIVHPLELIISLPIGKKAGHTMEKTVFGTLLCGFTWWLPVKLGVFTENEAEK